MKEALHYTLFFFSMLQAANVVTHVVFSPKQVARENRKIIAKDRMDFLVNENKVQRKLNNLTS